MKTGFLCAVLFLLVPFSALADEKTDLAQEFMELTHINQLVEQVKSQVMQFKDQLVAQVDVPDDKKQEASNFQEQVNAKVLEVMKFDQMQNEYVQLFANTYSTEELKEMIRFFKTPAGRNMLEKQPQAIRQALDISQSKIGILLPELQKMTEDFQKTLVSNP